MGTISWGVDLAKSNFGAGTVAEATEPASLGITEKEESDVRDMVRWRYWLGIGACWIGAEVDENSCEPESIRELRMEREKEETDRMLGGREDCMFSTEELLL